MKRALRNSDTSMFIKSDLGETGLIDEARSFHNYQEAFDFCKDNQLNRVELVVRVADNYEFIVEVTTLAPASTEESHPPEATLHQSAVDTVGLSTNQILAPLVKKLSDSNERLGLA